MTNAPPNTQVGYTVRTHRIVLAQRAAGLDPHVVTFPGWPNMADGDTAALRELDGIPYHRVRPGKQAHVGLHERIEVAVSEVTELARRLRPAVLHAASDHKNGTVAPGGVDSRTPLQAELKRLYEVRSRLVHGAKELADDVISKHRNRAVDISLELLRRLYKKRPDLLEMESEERSKKILFEG